MKVKSYIRKYGFAAQMAVLFLVLTVSVSAFADPVTVDESAVRGPDQYTGPLPLMITAFVKVLPTNTCDILPEGNDMVNSLYLFTLFDTGSTSVALSAQDEALLGIGRLPTKLDIRINGMGAINPATLGAPIGPPLFNPSQALASNVPVSSSTSNKGITQIGAPVTNKIIAYMDNRQTFRVSRGPYSHLTDNPATPDVDERMVSGPDIRFYSLSGFPGLKSIGKKEAVVLELEKFGTVKITQEGGYEGLRYYLRNVAFSDGGHLLTETAGSNLNCFWDSGREFTVISRTLATGLGLLDREQDFSCEVPGGSPIAGYEIDSIVMTGLHDGRVGETYTIQNARVCVDNSDVLLGGIADAWIGSNFFDQVPILFNGREDTLTILRDIKKGDFNEDDIVDCQDEALLRSEIQRPSQPVSIDGHVLVGYVNGMGNTIRVDYTADEMVRIKSVLFDFTGTNVIRNSRYDTCGGDSQIFDLPEGRGIIEDNVWVMNLDQLSTGTGTPLRSDYLGGRITVEINDGTLIETSFNAADSQELAQELVGAAARFSQVIPDFRLPADPQFDINADGKVDNLDLTLLIQLFDDPDSAPCDSGQVRPGDIDGDGQVATEQDAIALGEAFGSESGDDDFNAHADLDGNGRVNVDDLKIFRQIMQTD